MNPVHEKIAASRFWSNTTSRRLVPLGAASAISTGGDYCFAVAMPWLALSRHGGPTLLALVMASYGLPRTLLIPAGGFLADRWGSMKVMLAADVVRCLAAGCLVFASTRTEVRASSLAILAAVLGGGEGLFMPASFSLLPKLLPEEQLQAGNAAMTVATQLGTVVGPSVGGALVASFGVASAFGADAASFALSGLVLVRLISTRPGSLGSARRGGAPSEASSAASVWSFLRHSRLFKVVLGMSIAGNFALGGLVDIGLPGFAHRHLGAVGYGVILTGLGTGIIAGALLVARIGTLARPALVSLAVFALEGVGIAYLPFSPGLTGPVCTGLLVGACSGFADILILTLIQQLAPRHLLGRLMSIMMLGSYGLYPVSVLFFGAVLRAWGPVPCFPLAAAIIAVALLVGLGSREFRRLGSGAAAG